MSSGLLVHGVAKSYGTVRALDGVSLDVPKGAVASLVGPSGCGKTTLLRIIAGFISPDAGEVILGSTVVAGSGRGVRTQDREVGFVPQEGALFPHLDVASNIAFGLPRRERHGARVDELLDLLELPRDYATRFPHELSGGQQQRVAVARALAPSPAIMLLDEPFSSLDASLRASTGRSVMRAIRASGATSLLVTHDQEEALSLSDHVAVMRAGRILQVGTPAEVYTSPVDPYVATFVGNGTVLPATITGGRAACELGSVAVDDAPDGEALIFLRPEQVVSLGVSPDGALVEDVAYHGHHATVRLLLHPEGSIVVSSMPARVMPVVGQRLRLSVSGSARVFRQADTA